MVQKKKSVKVRDIALTELRKEEKKTFGFLKLYIQYLKQNYIAFFLERISTGEKKCS